jgi:hypothetical protein
MSQDNLPKSRWLEEEKFDFDWLITTSGQDYPVQPLHRIESFLENTSRDAFVEHEAAHFSLGSVDIWYKLLKCQL